MKEYLKMADVFPDNFNIDEIMVYNRESRKFNNNTLEEHVLHAIDSHDELVAEVERLREQVKDLSEQSDDYKESSERWRSEAGYWQSIAEE